MNRCRFAKEISAYFDKQLPEKRMREVAGHLAGCPHCARELAQIESLSGNLAKWHAPQASPGFEAMVKERIVAAELEKGKAPMKKSTLVWLAPSTALAAVLAFVVVGQVAQMYMQRGLSGRMKDSADTMGRVSIPEKSRKSPVQADGAVNMGMTGNYEPYYMRLNDHMVTSADSGDVQVASRVGYHEYPDREAEKKNAGYGARGGSEAFFAAAPQVTVPQEPGQGQVIVIQPSLPATGQGDKIIRTAELKIQVEDGKAAYQKAGAICQELGGYMASSNFYKDEEGREAGTITMRIPKDKFLTALERLGGLGILRSSTSDSRDVAQEYANLKSQLDAAMVVYNKMLDALNKRQVTIPDAMRLESEITPVLQRVQALKNQIEALDNAVSFTTVTVNFFEPAVSAKVLKDSKRYIDESVLTAKINAVKTLARVAPAAIPAAIFLVLGIVAVAAVIAGIKRIFRKE